MSKESLLSIDPSNSFLSRSLTVSKWSSRVNDQPCCRWWKKLPWSCQEKLIMAKLSSKKTLKNFFHYANKLNSLLLLTMCWIIFLLAAWVLCKGRILMKYCYQLIILCVAQDVKLIIYLSNNANKIHRPLLNFFVSQHCECTR